MKDAIDIGSAQIHNSHDVRGWPVSATITKLEFRPTGVHVEHTKNQGAGAWPNFRPPSWEGDLQYTLWIFLQISGQWHGSGCIEYWQSCDQNGGPPEEFAKNWYYDANRWGPMTGHQPAPGEFVGFMVSAGDARNNGAQSVQERSNIVVVPFPASGWVYKPADEPEPIPEPIPVPLPPVPGPPDSNPLTEQLTALYALVNDVKSENVSLRSRLDLVEAQHSTWPAAYRGQLKVPYVGGGLSFVADTAMTAAQLDAYRKGK